MTGVKGCWSRIGGDVGVDVARRFSKKMHKGGRETRSTRSIRNRYIYDDNDDVKIVLVTARHALACACVDGIIAAGLAARVQTLVPPSATSRLFTSCSVGCVWAFVVVSPFSNCMCVPPCGARQKLCETMAYSPDKFGYLHTLEVGHHNSDPGCTSTHAFFFCHVNPAMIMQWMAAELIGWKVVQDVNSQLMILTGLGMKLARARTVDRR
jgi:hypothetical protein